mgnify:CR=1 FL=1
MCLNSTSDGATGKTDRPERPVMATRAQKSAQRQVVNILGNWPEPHGGGALTDGVTLKGVEVAEDVLQVAAQLRLDRCSDLGESERRYVVLERGELVDQAMDVTAKIPTAYNITINFKSYSNPHLVTFKTFTLLH